MSIQYTPDLFKTMQREFQDQQKVLMRDLAPLAQILGYQPVFKSIKPDLLSVDVDAVHLVAVCRFVRDQSGFPLLSCITGVDMLDHLEIIYHIRSFSRRQVLQLRVRLSNEKPEVESIISVWPAANWLEREVYDLFGIRFLGHPDLRRILLDDDFQGYPLLKQFQQVPPSRKDQATTQVDPNMAIADHFRVKHYEQVVMSSRGQGMEERLHPGTPTFGDTQEGLQKRANENTSRREGESVTVPPERSLHPEK